MSHDEQIRQIRQKINLLIKRCKILEQENGKLKEENTVLNEQVKQQISSIDTLKSKNAIAGVQLSELSSEDKQTLKKKIDLYLKEIDKCIAAINVQ